MGLRFPVPIHSNSSYQLNRHDECNSTVVLFTRLLKQVGAGFWLQDPAAAKLHAEALAKAKYAEARDPRSCALLYAALGKKNLLQVCLVTCFLQGPRYEKPI